MHIDFQISSVALQEVAPFFQMEEETLSKRGIKRLVVDAKPAYPCRLSLEDAEIGEEVLLFSYLHHDTASPYRASGPIFVRKNATQAKLAVNVLPGMLLHRELSVRAYNKEGWMVAANTVMGNILYETIQIQLNNQAVDYIQIHNAKPGCYNCQVNRV